MRLLTAFVFIQVCLALPRAPSGPWDAFNYSPTQRTVHPSAIHDAVGNVANPDALLNGDGGSAELSGDGSYVVIDFGKEVGGVLSFEITDFSSDTAAISLAFTESSQFINPNASDDSRNSAPAMDVDGVEALPVPLATGTFTQPRELQRGGFRYLTIASNSDESVSLSNVSIHITFMPHWGGDLSAYTGYFFASDPIFEDADFLTKLWYAGAYTVQTNTISSVEMRGSPRTGWLNNASAGFPEPVPVLTDAAKRDRWVWPGDLGISTHSQLVSTTDLEATKNSLLLMYTTQDPETGALAYSGPPAGFFGSATYVVWNLIGTHSYWLYTGDLDMVSTVWNNYTKAVGFFESLLDEETGLVNVPDNFANDWGRDGGAGITIVPSVLYYRTLVTGAELAIQLGETDIAELYTQNATALKTAVNDAFWDGAAGLYRDNLDPDSIHPQDGNSLAVLFNVTTSDEQNQAISEGLTTFWTDIGSLSPELNDTIIPFVGGFELRAHFIAGEGERALDLMRRQWGYMLYTNLSVQSTLLEGFTANGSLGYRAAAGYRFDHSYTSHAHGWSTGPTSALTFHVLGIQLTSPQGATFTVAPVLSGLSAAEGGLSTELGFFGVNWTLADDNWTLIINAPSDTVGTIVFPNEVSLDTVRLNGEEIGVNESGMIQVEGGAKISIEAGLKP